MEVVDSVECVNNHRKPALSGRPPSVKPGHAAVGVEERDILISEDIDNRGNCFGPDFFEDEKEKAARLIIFSCTAILFQNLILINRY